MQHTVACLWTGCAWAAAVISAIAHIPIGLNNDTMTLLYQSQKLLGGAVPYVDYIEANPPLIHLIFMLPLMLAQLSGIKLYLAFNLFALAVAGASLLLCAISLHRGGVSRGRNGFITGSIAFGMLFLSFMHQLFGDREWLMLTLVAPLLLIYSPFMARERLSRRLRILAAVMAGIGFCIKPYALAIYLMALLYRYCFERSLSAMLREAEHYAIAGVGLCYLLVVVVFFGEYIHTSIPIGAETYGAIGWDLASKLDFMRHYLLTHYALPALAIVALLLLLAPDFYDRSITYTLFLATGGLASYVASAGWYYTQYPFIALSLMLAIAAGCRLAAACSLLPDAMRERLAVLALCSVFATGLWHVYAQPAISQASWDLKLMKERGRPINTSAMYPPAWAQVSAHLKTHPRFVFLSTNLWVPNLLAEGGAHTSVGRFDFLWPLPGILQMKDRPFKKESYERLSAWIAASIAQDLRDQKPDVVIVDRSAYQRGLPASYDMVEFFMKTPDFKSALAAYRLADSIDRCIPPVAADCAYRIYYRK